MECYQSCLGHDTQCRHRRMSHACRPDWQNLKRKEASSGPIPGIEEVTVKHWRDKIKECSIFLEDILALYSPRWDRDGPDFISFFH